jgi:hypothetical protein
VLFTASGGKDRMPVVVNALTSLGVRTRVVADFDVLREQNPLQSILTALGANWKEYEADWVRVKKAIDQIKPPLNTIQVRERIIAALDKEGGVLSDATIDAIKKTLRASSHWELGKLAGVGAVSSGDTRKLLNSLLVHCRVWRDRTFCPFRRRSRAEMGA